MLLMIITIILLLIMMIMIMIIMMIACLAGHRTWSDALRSTLMSIWHGDFHYLGLGT